MIFLLVILIFGLSGFLFLTPFFDAVKKFIILWGIVLSENQSVVSGVIVVLFLATCVCLIIPNEKTHDFGKKMITSTMIVAIVVFAILIFSNRLV